MGKKINKNQVIQVLLDCRAVGLKTKVGFSFGHIGETWQDTQETFRFLDQYGHLIDHPVFSVGILVYPGTRVQQYALSNNLLPEIFSWSVPMHKKDKNYVSWDNVPILLQPSWSYQELRRCYWQTFFGELKNLKRLKKHLKEINSWQAILRKVSCFAAQWRNSLYS
jgi:hypothetical protein